MNRNHVGIDLEICGWWNSWIPPQSAFHWVFWVCDQTDPGVTMCDILSADLESPRHAVTHQHSEAGLSQWHNSPKPLHLQVISNLFINCLSLVRCNQIEDQWSCLVPVSRPCRHDVPWCHRVSMKCCQQGFGLLQQIIWRRDRILQKQGAKNVRHS